MDIGKFVGTLFLSRDVSHRAHLKSNSYAEHEALGEFYEGLLCLTDGLVEGYQGRNGIIADIPILTNERATSDVVRLLEYHLAVIEKGRYSAVDKSDTALQSMVDDVVLCYLKVLYKLKNLK